MDVQPAPGQASVPEVSPFASAAVPCDDSGLVTKPSDGSSSYATLFGRPSTSALSMPDLDPTPGGPQLRLPASPAPPAAAVPSQATAAAAPAVSVPVVKARTLASLMPPPTRQRQSFAAIREVFGRASQAEAPPPPPQGAAAVSRSPRQLPVAGGGSPLPHRPVVAVALASKQRPAPAASRIPALAAKPALAARTPDASYSFSGSPACSLTSAPTMRADSSQSPCYPDTPVAAHDDSAFMCPDRSLPTCSAKAGVSASQAQRPARAAAPTAASARPATAPKALVTAATQRYASSESLMDSLPDDYKSYIDRAVAAGASCELDMDSFSQSFSSLLLQGSASSFAAAGSSGPVSSFSELGPISPRHLAALRARFACPAVSEPVVLDDPLLGGDDSDGKDAEVTPSPSHHQSATAVPPAAAAVAPYSPRSVLERVVRMTGETDEMEPESCDSPLVDNDVQRGFAEEGQDEEESQQRHDAPPAAPYTFVPPAAVAPSSSAAAARAAAAVASAHTGACRASETVAGVVRKMLPSFGAPGVAAAALLLLRVPAPALTSVPEVAAGDVQDAAAAEAGATSPQREAAADMALPTVPMRPSRHHHPLAASMPTLRLHAGSGGGLSSADRRANMMPTATVGAAVALPMKRKAQKEVYPEDEGRWAPDSPAQQQAARDAFRATPPPPRAGTTSSAGARSAAASLAPLLLPDGGNRQLPMEENVVIVNAVRWQKGGAAAGGKGAQGAGKAHHAGADTQKEARHAEREEGRKARGGLFRLLSQCFALAP